MAKHQIGVNEIISKIFNGKVSLASIFSYKTRYELGDLEDDDLVTKYLLGTITPGVEVEILAVIPAGTDIPFNIDMTIRPEFGLRPTILCEIPFNGDDTTLVPWSAILPVKNYADNTLSVLESIDIWGNSDGSAGNGKFNEDTYVTIKS